MLLDIDLGKGSSDVTLKTQVTISNADKWECIIAEIYES